MGVYVRRRARRTVLDLEVLDGVGKDRESGVVIRVELALKESVSYRPRKRRGMGSVLCDVPVDEQVSRLCSEDPALWYATICAAYPQDLWGLGILRAVPGRNWASVGPWPFFTRR